MALVYRAHFALVSRPIFTSKGANSSALFVFINTLLDILQNQLPTHIAVAFDTAIVSGYVIVYSYEIDTPIPPFTRPSLSGSLLEKWQLRPSLTLTESLLPPGRTYLSPSRV